MKNVRMTIWIVVTVLLTLVGQGVGVDFSDGGIHNIDYSLNNSVSVDYLAPDMHTTVNLLTGGLVHDLAPHHNSQVTMSGGTVIGNLQAWDYSHVTLSGGYVGGVLDAYGQVEITMSSGTVSSSLRVFGDSKVTMSGGSVGESFDVSNNSLVTMSGGSVGGFLGVGDISQMTMSGGTIGLSINVSAGATLIICGYNFAIDGNPVGLGTYSRSPVSSRLTGTLANGDFINNEFRGTITLIPEPATLLLLVIGSIILKKRIN